MRKVILVSIQCVAAILAGLVVMWGLASLKMDPKRVDLKEQSIHVTVLEVQPESSTIVVSGYGTAHNLNTVSLAAEVPGAVVEVNPRLERGEIIPKGEVLFKIDPRSYDLQVKAAEANLNQTAHALELIEAKHQADIKRLEGLKRLRDLAKSEHGRVQGLFEKNVGAQHGVELAEGALIQAEDTVIEVQQAIDAYPQQRGQAESLVKAAEAQLDQAKLAYERTTVVAPFNARIKSFGGASPAMAMGMGAASSPSQGLEVNQYVGPGVPVITLADDSMLEISVPLDSNEARDWLLFDEVSQGENAWFDKLKPVECAAKWTEDDQSQWKGVVDRVENFDERTRTLTVVVRLTGEQAAASTGTKLPLVDGMFCEVAIPGRSAENVFRVPRKAVNFDGTVYIDDGDRLRTAKVKVAHEQGSEVLVSEGLKPGDRVITTRLVNPMENALLEIETDSAGGSAS